MFSSSALPSANFEAAQAWYERFFGRPADIVADQLEVMWRVTDGGWLYVLRKEDHAGKSIAAIAVPNIEEATSTLEMRRAATGPIEPEGNAGRKPSWLIPTATRDHRGLGG